MRKIVMAALILAACQFASAAETALTDKEKAAVISAVKEQLNDPDSAKFKWGKISAQFAGKVFANYCVLVNSRNTYGGYDGFKPYIVMLFWGNEGFAAELGSKPNPEYPKDIYEMCAEDGYKFNIPK